MNSMNFLNRVIVMTLAVSAVVWIGCGRVWAQEQNSDNLYVDPVLNPLFGANGPEYWNVFGLNLSPFENNGYVLFYEPGPGELSDILQSLDGTSLELYSDGATDFPGGATTIQQYFDYLVGFNYNQLGSFVETDTGITVSVGDLFGVGNDQIIVTSDGNLVPEPGTLLLSVTGLVSLVGYVWRRTKLTA